MKKLSACAAGLVFAAGCGGGATSTESMLGSGAPPHATSAERHDALPRVLPEGATVLAKLRTRDATLVVLAGDGEPRFAVADNRGGARLLADDELRQSYPDLHRAYRSGMARTGMAKGAFLDARLDSEHRSSDPVLPADPVLLTGPGRSDRLR